MLRPHTSIMTMPTTVCGNCSCYFCDSIDLTNTDSSWDVAWDAFDDDEIVQGIGQFTAVETSHHPGREWRLRITDQDFLREDIISDDSAQTCTWIRKMLNSITS